MGQYAIVIEGDGSTNYSASAPETGVILRDDKDRHVVAVAIRAGACLERF